ncbi:MAG: S41 family peptidase [Firmicutes bacterium HGW-Firmicutes-11]|jgi:carboxyl-terminal processing protease|nr:MAG: S41 family peptidase [Firmicutes bacterium HGW-Firmicutes-11]
MITLKRRNLILLLVVVLAIGGVTTGAWMKAKSIINDNIGISQKQYEEYLGLKEDYGDIEELKRLIEEKYYVPVDENELEEGLRKGLFWGIGDPYSAYLSKEEYDALMIATSGEYQGIGVTIAPDDKGFINVVAPMDGTPAHKAGIQSGDKVIFVDGKEYSADSIDAAAAAMRGEVGTKVEVGLLRGVERIDLTLTRANILLETVRSELLEGDIGYIRISSFEERTADDFAQALRSMELEGAKGLVIDLRDNPGGLVDVAVDVADQLMEAGVVTYTEDRQGKKEFYKSRAGATKLPFVILINKGSASASEIIAGAVKDSGAGELVGITTYGKGIIQQIVPLENGDATKLTIMQYFSPEGNVIHEIGVEPDHVVELTEEDLTEGILERENDRQLKKAVELLQ